jgi:hypothetical protein
MKVERRDGDRYSLRNLVTGKDADFHVQLLKPFLYDERVHDEYLVEQIMEHRYTERVNGRPRGL